jgi:hypothetical protein
MNFPVLGKNSERCSLESILRHQQVGKSGKLTRLLFSLSLLFVLCGFYAPGMLANAATLRLQPFVVADQQMGGTPAFRILAPADWKLHGGLFWNANLANLVTADLSITAPDNSAGFYVHPSPMFISGQIEYQWPRGKLYLGMIVMPIPSSPVEFLQQIVLPRQRAQARDLRLLEHEELPAWAGSIAATNTQSGVNTQGFGVRARFGYTENGQNWEEDFYCVVLVSRPQMGPPALHWMAERNLSVRALAGKLDAIKPLANVFVNSFRIERNWYGRFVKIQQQWIAARQQGIANAGALSRAISRSNDQFSQALMQSWNERQQAQDRANREFSEYIRGSENYYDPVKETRVELPGGYDHVWTNVMGEYILSNDAGFDPNMNSNLDWEAINPVQ